MCVWWINHGTDLLRVTSSWLAVLMTGGISLFVSFFYRRALLRTDDDISAKCRLSLCLFRPVKPWFCNGFYSQTLYFNISVYHTDLLYIVLLQIRWTQKSFYSEMCGFRFRVSAFIQSQMSWSHINFVVLIWMSKYFQQAPQGLNHVKIYKISTMLGLLLIIMTVYILGNFLPKTKRTYEA